VAWALGMTATNGLSHVGWSVFTVLAAVASFWLLGLAMRGLPVGTACAVWVGIGAAGVAIFAIVCFGDAATPMRIAGLLLILPGAGLPKAASGPDLAPGFIGKSRSCFGFLREIRKIALEIPSLFRHPRRHFRRLRRRIMHPQQCFFLQGRARGF
jgi:quaternary ammonium compound-resistance protein SugE